MMVTSRSTRVYTDSDGLSRAGESVGWGGDELQAAEKKTSLA
jgi:hypothetical protein